MDDYREDLAYTETKKIAQWTRFVGTEGEAKAKRYIYGQFIGRGIECQREPFTCSTFLTKILLPVGLAIIAGLTLGASYLYLQGLFIFALIVSILLLIVLLIANLLWTGSDIGTSLGKQFQLENLLGYMKAKNPNPKKTVVIISHYDTKSQTFPLILRITLFVIGALGSLTIVLILILFSIIALSTGINYLNGNILFYFALGISLCNISLIFNFTENKSVGATDNAAAVGVQIAILRNLLDFPPENTDVYFLSTTAEEIGLMGATAFIKKHESHFNKDTTYFLNYDVIGGEGDIILHTKYGLPPKSTSPEINNLLLEIAQEKKLKVSTQYLPIGAAADHLPILKRGFKTTWIQTGDRKVTTKIHTPRDNMDLITKESLRTAIILGFEFIRRIDSA
ncbi:MAG: M28 family metallopeptidase [Candidatus Helarchaeota archaeon]